MFLKLFILSCILYAAEGIIGGKDAPEDLAPYQVSLQGGLGPFCSGTILSSRWILTSGYCIKSYSANLDILVGTNDLLIDGTYHTSQKRFTHESYDWKTGAYDFGLIKTREEIEFNDKVQPIKYSEKIVPEDTVLQATGWGLYMHDGEVEQPTKLQVIKLNTISNDKCQKFFADAPNAPEVHEGQLCTITKENEGIRKGDFGDPLVWNNELVGVANYFYSQSKSLYPDKFGRVSYVYDWIKNKTTSD